MTTCSATRRQSFSPCWVYKQHAERPVRPGLEFQGEGLHEQAIITAIADPEIAPALKVGDSIVRVDPRYFRPAEVETLLGDPTRARERLGWVPEISVQDMVAEMVAEDLQTARRYALLKAHGHSIPITREDGR